MSRRHSLVFAVVAIAGVALFAFLLSLWGLYRNAIEQQLRNAARSTEIPFDGASVAPVYRALRGENGGGEVIGYRGGPDIAGYAPVPNLGIAVVYKTDISEVRRPFLSAAAWIVGATMLSVTSLFVGFFYFNRRLAKRLDESETRFAAVISVTPVGVYEADAEGNYTFVNERWSVITGVDATVAMADGWIKTVHNNDREVVLHAWREFVSGIAPFTCQYRAAQASGQEVWVLGQAVAMKDRNGRIRGYTGTITDITSIQLTKQRLALKSAAIEHALNAIAMSDYDGKLTYVNPSFVKMWGYASQEQILGRNLSEFCVAPEQATVIVNDLRQHGRWAGALDARRIDGQIFIVETLAVLIRDANGRPQHMLASFVDVTERKHAEDVILRRSAQLRHAQELARVGAWELDLATDELTWSEQTFQIFGLNPSENANNFAKFWEAVHPDDCVAVEAAYQRSIQNHEPYEVVHRIILPDGTIKWVQERGETQYTADGVARRTIGAVQDITERRNFESALSDSEERYRSVIATMSEGVVVQEASGAITTFNAAAEDILGLSSDQLRGRTAMDPNWKSVKEDGSPFPGTEHPGTVALSTGKSFRNVIMGVDHPLKGRRWISINAHPLFLPDKRTPYGSVASFTDITEHRQHEAQINASNQILTAVLDNTPVLIAYLDRDMNFIRVNESYAQADGKSPDYFPGKNHFALFPHAENEAIFHRVVTTGVAHVARAKPFEYERNPERGVSHWDWTLVPIKDVQEHVTGLVLSLTNVTERIEALEAAQRSREELKKLNESLEQRVAERTRELNEAGELNRQMIAASSVGIAAYSADGHCVFANAAIGTMIGASHDHMLAQNFRENPSWKEYGVLDLALKTLDTNVPQHQEFFMVTSFGKRVCLDIYFAPFQRGGTSHLLLILHDITARKQAENSLIGAKEAAEKASKGKSEFLARMSHELRTPMNAILGFSQVLELELAGQEIIDFVHEIHRAGDHLLELINELLDLSRIEAGKMVMVLQAIEVGNAANETVKIVQPILEQKRVEFTNKCSDEVFVLADPTRLRQVLLNLFSNAAKYNRDGGSIEFTCSRIDSDRVRLSVTDTGLGIPAEKINNLFIPFERLGHEFGSVDGTGIGLALSKQLTELMGGRIGVTSQYGKGSTFWIELSIAHVVKAKTSTGNNTPPLARSRYNVLYIEDNAANLRLVEAIFRQHPQVTLLSATTGETGVVIAKRYKPDAILLDIHLPDMDGYAVLDALRRDDSTQRIPILALSADAMPIDIERGLNAGFRRYLTKPLNVELLLQSLDEILGN